MTKDDPQVEEARNPYDAWLPAARQGDRDAIEAVLGLLRPAVLRYCLSRVGDRDGAQDVTQEVMIGVSAGLLTYEDRGLPFQAFAFRIAQRRVVDHHRRQGRNLAVTSDVLPEAVDQGPTPDQVAESRERAAYTHTLLDKLTPDQREIMMLRVAAGLSAEEVGAMLGRTAVAVRVAQHRALNRLRAMAQADLAAGRERP